MEKIKPMFKSIIGTIIILTAFTGHVFAKTLTLSIDDRYWYPFTYIKNSTAMGMHVDITKKALSNLGYTVNIKAIPRKRAIKYLERGKIDGVISLAHNPGMSPLIDFPPDAQSKQESQWRIMQVDQMVITHIDNNYEFDGYINSIPTPVRLPLGESFTTNLRSAGLVVEETKTDVQNFKMLTRDKKGSVITASVIAEIMFIDPNFKDQFTIQPIPLISQSYYLAFSSKTPLSAFEKRKIWDEIARLRDDYVYMLQVFAHY